jgi:phage terminase large subunit
VLKGVKHTQNSEKVTFPNGSKILIGGYNDDRDIEKYIGIEYDGIVVEEATQIRGEQHERLAGSLRTSKQDWVPREYLSSNPGAIGHQFIKEKFIEPYNSKTETTTRRFFSSYADNPFINPEYKTYLESLTGDLAKAWREGDWDIFAGQAFSSWRHDRHIIKPFEIQGWARWRAVDWGYSNPFCCLWLTRNPDNGRIYVYRELYATQLTDRQQARTILDMTPPDESVNLTYADPSMWASKNVQDITSSSADEYAQTGVPLTRADNDRLSGKRKLDRLLEPLADGLPGIQIFENCHNLIRTLPAMVYDDVRTEDIDTDQEDHAYDALRYGLTQARDYTGQRKINRDNPWLKVKGI